MPVLLVVVHELGLVGMVRAGVFFIYDYSPFMVERKDHSRSFIGFLTRIFAIIGGMYKVCSCL